MNYPLLTVLCIIHAPHPCWRARLTEGWEHFLTDTLNISCALWLSLSRMRFKMTSRRPPLSSGLPPSGFGSSGLARGNALEQTQLFTEAPMSRKLLAPLERVPSAGKAAARVPSAGLDRPLSI